MRTAYDGDGYVALGGPKLRDEVFVTVTGGLAKLIKPARPKGPTSAAEV